MCCRNVIRISQWLTLWRQEAKHRYDHAVECLGNLPEVRDEIGAEHFEKPPARYRGTNGCKPEQKSQVRHEDQRPLLGPEHDRRRVNVYQDSTS